VILFYDLSERKALEQSAQEAAYLGGVAESSAEMIHSFGNGVTAIRFYLQELQQMEQFTLRMEEMLRAMADASGAEVQEGEFGLQQLADAMAEANERYLGATLAGVSNTAEQLSALVLQSHQMVGDGAGYWSSQFGLEEVVAALQPIVERHYGVVSVRLEAGLGEVRLPKKPLLQLAQGVLEQLIVGGGSAAVVRQVVLEIVPDHKPDHFQLRYRAQGVDLQQQRDTLFAAGSDGALHAAANFVRAVGGVIEMQNLPGEQQGVEGELKVVLPCHSGT
jgi:hypothetical protein